MMKTTEPRWYDLLREFFGVNLTQDRVAMWVKLLHEPDALGRDLAEDDLCAVLRWVRKQREGEHGRKPPTLETLIGWVKWFRKEQAAARRGYMPGSHDSTGRIAAARQAMLRAKSHGERWNLLCEMSKSQHECQVLDAWAAQKWGYEYTLERDDLIKWMASQIRALCQTLISKQRMEYGGEAANTWSAPPLPPEGRDTP